MTSSNVGKDVVVVVDVPVDEREEDVDGMDEATVEVSAQAYSYGEDASTEM